MIKAGNGTMKKRDDRTAFAQSCRLNLPALLRWLLMVFVLAGPGYAYAFPGCTHSNGQTTAVRMNLPPSVTFLPGITPDLSKPLYTSPEYNIDYECTNDGLETQVTISLLKDLKPLTGALKGFGIQLKFRIRDKTSGQVQEVTYDDSTGALNFVYIGNSYKGTTTGTLYISLNLYLTKVPPPGFYAVPALSVISILPQWSASYGYFLITTDATRIQYVPTCFVKASVDSVVNFGPVLTSDINSKFSMSRSFNVGAGVNNAADCDIGNLTKGYDVKTSDGQKRKYFINLPLKVEFLVTGGETVSSDSQSIILKNDSGEYNGLQLKISDEANNVVTFGEVLQPGSNFASQLGAFDEGNFTVSKKYYATLSQAPGKTVKTGKYSAKVTVKVSYY
ncbi:fimbrial protein [Salmonella enterica]|nr:fimbrial protein [Salmonella enterica]EKB5476527.1 fimbrial protein [Salmonella enterica]ELL0515349.1 fimbrial protein [Salmonella enterica]